jgi:3-dehydroquinate synthase
MNKFIIDNVSLQPLHNFTNNLEIISHPKNYSVIFDSFNNSFDTNDFLLIDNNVQKLYDINHKNTFIINPIESNKNIETVLKVCQWLCDKGFNKGHRLFVIGGGITQDIGAFVGSIYKRGINWVYIPTTLLSQCDSCIGGKTALNFHSIKNQLALFSAPSLVIIDPKFLKTLNSQDIINGMGEIIKFFILGGISYIEKINQYSMQERIFHGLAIKKSIIEYDEFEINIRKALNYGHSFGHAIEAATNYTIPHGEAVLLGIEIINRLFTNNNNISKIISEYTSLDKIKNLKTSTIIELLKQDKKTKLNKITLVVPSEIGITNFIDSTLDQQLAYKLNEIFTN